MSILNYFLSAVAECATTFAVLVWTITLSLKYYDSVEELCRIVFGFGLDD